MGRPLRFAVAYGPEDHIKPYLPSNYNTLGTFFDGDRRVTLIVGFDSAGWTLEDDVIPRLASGLYVCTELVPKEKP